MKKPFVLIAAIVAVVGFGAAVAVAKETIKVETSVKLHFNPGDESFSGTVKAKNGCQKGRTVTLTQGGKKLGSDKSDNRGKYKIIGPVIGLGGGGLRAVASERKITKNNGDRIVCKTGKSNKLPRPLSNALTGAGD